MALTRQRSLVCVKLESDGAESSFLELCNVIVCVLGMFDSSISPIFHIVWQARLVVCSNTSFCWADWERQTSF